MRRSVRLLPLLFAIAMTGCSNPDGPSLVVSDVRVLAPVPGSGTGVAYLTLANRGGDPVAIGEFRSPQFERVEMHETTLDDGVSRMRPLDSIEIAAGQAVEFAAGGRHLMLIGPGAGTVAGSSVEIEIVYSGGLVVVSATMSDRLDSE